MSRRLANTVNRAKDVIVYTTNILVLFQALLQKFATTSEEEDSDYTFSFGNLFRCVCCPRPRQDHNESKFEMILEKLETIEKAVGGTQVRLCSTIG